MRRRNDMRLGDLKGEEGLLIAVIARAVKDAKRKARADPEIVADARAYFAGDDYPAHLELLGLPTSFIPMEFQHE